MTYPLPLLWRPLAPALQNIGLDASHGAVNLRGTSGHTRAGNRGKGEGKRGGRPIIRWGVVAALKSIFSKGPTASEIGKLGNAVKREQQRAKVRAKCDEMREKMGLPAARWPQ